jgi:hypothetical protein
MEPKSDGSGRRAWLGLLLLGLLVGLGLSLVWPTIPSIAPTLHLTGDNNGQTVQMQIGQELDLDLGAEYSDVHSNDPRVLAEKGAVQTCGDYIPCARYRFVAQAVGETDIVAWRRAVCKPDEMCPLFIISWSLHVQVKAH